jgi:bifunctional DNA-binding transcriptional regulator/antitoxin component of YhaV-PrlF toxin-antitoxin module
VTIPAPIVRQLDLSHGDVVAFDQDDTGYKLKFLKLSDMVEPVAEG